MLKNQEATATGAPGMSEIRILWALYTGGGPKGQPGQIALILREESDPKEAVKRMREAYGTGGHSLTWPDGGAGFIDYDSRGIRIRDRKNGTAAKLTWAKAEKLWRRGLAS